MRIGELALLQYKTLQRRTIVASLALLGVGLDGVHTSQVIGIERGFRVQISELGVGIENGIWPAVFLLDGS